MTWKGAHTSSLASSATPELKGRGDGRKKEGQHSLTRDKSTEVRGVKVHGTIYYSGRESGSGRKGEKSTSVRNVVRGVVEGGEQAFSHALNSSVVQVTMCKLLLSDKKGDRPMEVMR